MSAREGEVWLVEAGCWTNRKVALRLAEGWSHVNGVNVDGDGIVTPLHRLAVVDFEDRGAVEQLVRTWLTEYDGCETKPRDAELDAMQAALREFASPAPPKPDEPTGLGAVVETVHGELYVRDKTTTTVAHWKRARGEDSSKRYKYAALAVVRVLSEGVAP